MRYLNYKFEIGPILIYILYRLSTVNEDMDLQLALQLNRIRPSSPMDEEQSIGSGDADSVGSSGSAGMANFGRTPSPVCF